MVPAEIITSFLAFAVYLVASPGLTYFISWWLGFAVSQVAGTHFNSTDFDLFSVFFVTILGDEFGHLSGGVNMQILSGN